MKCDIILAGVGGQGILSIATVIGQAALASGLHLKQSEVHGMSQRGGDVQSHLRLSDQEIHSDLIPAGTADLILSVEPMEALRYLPFLGESGWLLTNTRPFVNIPNYPAIEDVLAAVRALPRHLTVDAEAVAREVDNPRGMNMVMAGAATPFLGLPYERVEAGVRSIFGPKGEDVVRKNLAALAAGRALAEARSA